ncbi:MAG: MFS transporter [Firmicutes bacterium]|nr:MFS transporter [Bacillota bacterium]
MHNPRLWTKDFITDALINFINYLVYYSLIVTITVYATDNLKASPSEAGLATGIFILGMIPARIFAGRAIERLGRKKMLFIGLFSYLITTLLYFWIDNLMMLYIIRFLHGAGFGISGTSTGTIAAGIIPPGRRGEGISYYAMSVTLASAFGPFLGMYLVQRGSFNTILFLALILLSIGIIGSFILKVPEAVLTEEQLNKLKEFSLHSFFEAKAVPIAAISMVICLAFSSLLSFLSSFTRELDLVGPGSFFFIVYSIAILVSRPVSGILFDKRGENFVMYPAFLIFSIGLAVLAQAHQAFTLLLAAMIIGLGYGTFLSSAQAIAIKVSPHHRIGLATSTFFSLIDAGAGIGPFLLGFMIPFTGYPGMYLSMAVLAFSCSFLYFFLHGRKAARL